MKETIELLEFHIQRAEHGLANAKWDNREDLITIFTNRLNDYRTSLKILNGATVKLREVCVCPQDSGTLTVNNVTFCLDCEKVLFATLNTFEVIRRRCIEWYYGKVGI